MANQRVSRRLFMSTAAMASVSAPLAARAGARATSDEGFSYEITRTEKEWKTRLTAEEFRILREGGTEKKHTSPLTTETREGTYHCRGCELSVYDNLWKVPLDIGWVFFRHARPDSVLTGIDGAATDSEGNDIRILAAIEVHCRRCGSHLGHIVHAQGQLVHCINGASLTFQPASA